MKHRVEEHEGHRIVIRERESDWEVVIDGARHRALRLPNGRYVLERHAYEPAEDLVGLAVRYLAHLERVRRVRETQAHRHGGH